MLISFLVGMCVGAALLYWRFKHLRREQRRIPKEWPLRTRPLVNSKEQRVWLWLSKVMFDQQILVKLPVTRFTTPANAEQATHWYKILNGVYCTFTVCSMDGKVIGCVDVSGSKGPSMSNQTLKHTLLEQCDIRYWVVDPMNLPHLTQIRSAFLGDQAIVGSEREKLESHFKNVRGSLQAAVTRRRREKPTTGQEQDSQTPSDFPESRLATGWEVNSFVTPLDSRTGDLRNGA